MPDAPAFAVIVDTEPKNYVGRHRRDGSTPDDESTAKPQTIAARSYVGQHTDQARKES